MRRTRHRRYLALLGLTIGLALVLTSCFGGDDETDDSTTTTQASTPPPPPVDPPQPPQPPDEPVIFELPQPPDEPVIIAVPPLPPPEVSDPPAPPPVDPTEPLIYTVQQGDTLFSIARQFGVSVDTLIEINDIANPDVIFVDDTLTIPPPG